MKPRRPRRRRGSSDQFSGAGTQYFLADSEIGTVTPPWTYNVHDIVPPGSPTAPVLNSTARAHTGTRSFLFEKSGTILTSPEGKVQVLQSGPALPMGPAGRFCGEGWYSWWSYIDSGFNENGWEMFLGWVGSNAAGSPGTDPICHMGLMLINGQLQVIYWLKNSGADGDGPFHYTPPAIPGYQNEGTNLYTMTANSPSGIVPFPRFQWVHLSIFYKMARTDGRVQIWQNGIKLMDLTHPIMNTYDGFVEYNNALGNMTLQFGHYSGERTEVQRLYVDEFQVSNVRIAA